MVTEGSRALVPSVDGGETGAAICCHGDGKGTNNLVERPRAGGEGGDAMLYALHLLLVVGFRAFFQVDV